MEAIEQLLSSTSLWQFFFVLCKLVVTFTSAENYKTIPFLSEFTSYAAQGSSKF